MYFFTKGDPDAVCGEPCVYWELPQYVIKVLASGVMRGLKLEFSTKLEAESQEKYAVEQIAHVGGKIFSRRVLYNKK